MTMRPATLALLVWHWAPEILIIGAIAADAGWQGMLVGWCIATVAEATSILATVMFTD